MRSTIVNDSASRIEHSMGPDGDILASAHVRYICYPRTEPPPHFVSPVASVFATHECEIGTATLSKGLTSNEVLNVIRSGLVELGFQVEIGKHREEKIHRPVFFGENGAPVLKYEIDAYHEAWHCGLEVEAGRAWMGNAVYRDLVQALVMVEMETLVLAVPNAYRYLSGGRDSISRDYDNAVGLAETLYSHSRFRLPYRLVVIGY